MWFTKKKKHTGKPSPHDTTAQWIATGIIRLQLRLARRLSNWEKGLSIRQKKIMLLLFCVVGGLYFLYLLGRSFIQPAKQKANHPRSISTVLPQAKKSGKDSIMQPHP